MPQFTGLIVKSALCYMTLSSLHHLLFQGLKICSKLVQSTSLSGEFDNGRLKATKLGCQSLELSLMSDSALVRKGHKLLLFRSTEMSWFLPLLRATLPFVTCNQRALDNDI